MYISPLVVRLSLSTLHQMAHRPSPQSYHLVQVHQIKRHPGLLSRVIRFSKHTMGHRTSLQSHTIFFKSVTSWYTIHCIPICLSNAQYLINGA
jgi:hypothetical protein